MRRQFEFVWLWDTVCYGKITLMGDELNCFDVYFTRVRN